MIASIQYTFTANNAKPIDGPIVFDPTELRNAIMPHEDALVLVLTMGGHLVNRILVDPRSFVNLLHLSAFLLMGYKTDVLHSLRRILRGFNGSKTVSLGEIVLPTNHLV